MGDARIVADGADRLRAALARSGNAKPGATDSDEPETPPSDVTAAKVEELDRAAGDPRTLWLRLG
jgi:hypothetical protein